MKTNVQMIPTMKRLIESNSLTAHFQQIVSVSRKMVVGVEGLIRGVDPRTEKLIPPTDLFLAAKEEQVSLELDRACREAILKEFSKVYPYDREKMLFLNLDAAILEECIGSGYLLDQISRNNISPRNVVIEVSEKNVLSDVTLKKFVDTHKQHGFLMALDDVGTGFSNMDRILLVKPDIIKIDHSLVDHIDNDFYKQGIFKSFVILANQIGALVIAEGIETEEEAIQVLRLGGHMLQGFYFSTPGEIGDQHTFYFNGKIDLLSLKFKKNMNLQYQEQRNKYKKLNKIVQECIQKLSDQNCDELDCALMELISVYDEMECVYILDSTGLQISGTICSNDGNTRRANQFFYSAQKGTDHSIEEYYYPLVSVRQKKYVTEPYVSLATGHLCITISAVFKSKDNIRCIFCADFIAKENSYHIEVRSPIVHAPAKAKSEITGMIEEMNKEIFKDGLTGAFDRRYMKARLEIDTDHISPLSVMLIDIDRFKMVNDTFGHLAGDQVLKKFVEISKRCIRSENDWIARYGGDEFLIVLNHADETVAGMIGERIRKSCERDAVQFEGKTVNFTVSLGTYTSYHSGMPVDTIIDFADKSLYIAKKSGKNRVVTDIKNNRNH